MKGYTEIIAGNLKAHCLKSSWLVKLKYGIKIKDDRVFVRQTQFYKLLFAFNEIAQN